MRKWLARIVVWPPFFAAALSGCVLGVWGQWRWEQAVGYAPLPFLLMLGVAWAFGVVGLGVGLTENLAL